MRLFAARSGPSEVSHQASPLRSLVTQLSESLAVMVLLAAACPLPSSAEDMPQVAVTADPASSSGALTKPTHDDARSHPWSLHFQNTDILEAAAPFRSNYAGTHSLNSGGETADTVSADLFVARRLWRGAQINADLLLWQGFGLSRTFGIENFPEADAYKAGTTRPNVMFSHLNLQQTIGFGGDQRDVADGPMKLAGRQDVSRLTLMVGRMTPLDVLDQNRYAGDGHTQFMSWGGTANMTWDYGQDTIGYETGFMTELNQRAWAVRYAFFLMPPYVNTDNVGSGDGGDDRILTWPARGRYGPVTKSWAQAIEWEGRYALGTHPGAIRLLAWRDQAKSVEYDLAAQVLQEHGADIDLTPYEAYHHSYGWGVNLEQEITPAIGVFSRIGWNDGQTQALEFTDTNAAISVGASLNGQPWRRPHDACGLAAFTAAASRPNQLFLAAGGLGILSGDGQLTYGIEKSLTLYYDSEVARGVHAAIQYQLTVDPSFNRDRGPVSTVMFRLHFQG